MPHFFHEIFQDFAIVVGKLQQLVGRDDGFQITATLLHATKLRFGVEDNGHGSRPPTRLPALQWRIRHAAHNMEFDRVAADMARDLLGAYGRFVR